VRSHYTENEGGGQLTGLGNSLLPCARFKTTAFRRSALA
jgi:hypothetical protein